MVTLDHAAFEGQDAPLGPRYLMPPLTPEAEEPLVSSLLLRALTDVLRQRGQRVEGVLSEVACRRLSEAGECMVPLNEFQDALQMASRATRDPGLALQVCFAATPASFGLMAPLVSHAPTLRCALGLAARFSPLFLEGVELSLSERLGVAQVRVDFLLGHRLDRMPLMELTMGGLMRALQGFGCGPGEAVRANFPYRTPAHYNAYVQAFGPQVRFLQSQCALEFPASMLDRPHLHSLSAVHGAVLEQAERQLQQRSRPQRYEERVRTLLSSRPPDRMPTMEQAAQCLGVSARSMRRRLEEEGTSFRILSQEALYNAACSLLRDPNNTLQQVAAALGFSDSTTFHRAFKRWSGLTPAHHRRARPAPSAPPLGFGS